MKSPYGNKSKQDWCTPQWFTEIIRERFGPIRLDACAEDATVSVCPERFYSPDQDGLLQPWQTNGDRGVVWCNPPFKQPEPWIEKALNEARYFDTSTIMLLPCSPEVGWWRRHHAKPRHIHLIYPRLSYWDPVEQRLRPGVSKPSCLWEIRPPVYELESTETLEMKYFHAPKPRGAIR